MFCHMHVLNKILMAGKNYQKMTSSCNERVVAKPVIYLSLFLMLSLAVEKLTMVLKCLSLISVY